MTLDNAVDTLIVVTPRLTDVLDRLSENDGFKALMEKRGKMSTSSFVLRLCPILLSPANRNDIYAILAAISGKTVNDIGSMEVSEVIHLVMDAFADEDMRLFLMSLFVNTFTEGE